MSSLTIHLSDEQISAVRAAQLSHGLISDVAIYVVSAPTLADAALAQWMSDAAHDAALWALDYE